MGKAQTFVRPRVCMCGWVHVFVCACMGECVGGRACMGGWMRGWVSVCTCMCG